MAVAGRLTLVPTPLGNLEDITLRALRTLRECDVVLAEDTRRTLNLLRAHHVERPLERMDEHASPERIAALVARMTAGARFALCSDAGTPLVSDPGASLVSAAIDAQVAIDSLPGACAAITAWTLAGFGATGFRFVGFLPREGPPRRAALTALGRDPLATVLYEAPSRLHATLLELGQVCGGERRAAVARELTKVHEEMLRGELGELAQRTRGEVLGEVTVVVQGAAAVSAGAELSELDEALRAALASGLKASQAAREVSQLLGLPRAEVYRRALALGTCS